MNIEETEISEVLLLTPRRHADSRGYFFESWERARYAPILSSRADEPVEFVQDNVSRSSRGTLRGLHFQKPTYQGKLVSCLVGEIFDVAVDIRVGSPTFGKWVGRRLSEGNGSQLWVPRGMAHGFLVLSDETIVSYKCDAPYAPGEEGGVLWSDPQVGIDWPEEPSIVSEKDRNWPTLRELDSGSDHLG